MCGIVGFNFRDRELLLRMMKTIEHRGPDQHAGILISNFSLGHQRLSIIDLSEKGKQPMCNEEGDKWITFNGEIYNFKSLRYELEKKGHQFKSNTDTETILHAYEEYGYDCVNYLDGMFAFAILDGKKLFLARDPVGIKPLYYNFENGNFFFASEIKAILEATLKATVNYNALNELLSYRIVSGNETLFQGIYKLLPGHYLIFEDGKIVSNQYYNFNVGESFSDEDALAKEFLEIFERSVKKRLIADVPLGAFLSGGLDSSCVVGIMSKFTDKVKTFTVGFNEEHDEMPYARKIAEHFNTEHYEVFIDYKDITKKFEDIVYHMDEPIADPAIFPVYFVSKLAREKVKVALFGEGADELFAGYNKYSILNKKLFPLNRYLKTDRIFLRDKRKFFKNGNNNVDNVMKNYFQKNWNLNNALLFDFKEVLPNFQLMKVDKMTMMSSIEGRVPFLDKELVSFAFGLPVNLKMNNMFGKYIVRKAMNGIVPDEILFGKKRVFFTPLKKWFDTGLRETAFDVLSNSKLFNKRNVLKLLHKEKYSWRRYKYSNQLWTLLMAEIWYKKFIEKYGVVI